MALLCQLIAVANGKKSQATAEITRLYHLMQKPEPLSGISRQYKPKDEEGEKLPPERKDVQVTVSESIKSACAVIEDLFDAVAAQDNTNTLAKADVIVDEKPVLKSIPVTHLLFLEKQLVDIHTFVEKLPTLDPAERWTYDPAAGVHRTDVSETTKTKKIPKNHIKFPPTKEHPAQVEVFHEDVLVGNWSTTKFSGAIPADERRAMLTRVRKLQEAVKMAREAANQTKVEDLRTGRPVLEYIFGERA